MGSTLFTVGIAFPNKLVFLIRSLSVHNYSELCLNVKFNYLAWFRHPKYPFVVCALKLQLINSILLLLLYRPAN